MRNRAIYTGIVILVTLLSGLVFNVLYIKHVDRQNDQRDIKRSQQFCEVSEYVEEQNRKLASPTPDQRAFIEKWHNYHVSLNCPK